MISTPGNHLGLLSKSGFYNKFLHLVSAKLCCCRSSTNIETVHIAVLNVDGCATLLAIHNQHPRILEGFKSQLNEHHVLCPYAVSDQVHQMQIHLIFAGEP